MMAHGKEELSVVVVATVRDVLGQEMRPFGMTEVTVTLAPDHDGDPSLWVDVSYSGEGAPVDPKIMAGVLRKLRDRLWARGEERFPYGRHHFPDDQKILGFR